MSRTVLGVIAVLVLLLLLPLAVSFQGKGLPGANVGVTTPLHEAAADGDVSKVTQLLSGGANPKGVDANGKTPLHLSAEHGHVETSQALLKGGADANAVDASGKRPLDYAVADNHNATAEVIRPSTTDQPALSAQGLNPDLKYRDEDTFAAAIGQPACLLKSEHVYLFAPKSREEAAGIVFPYLVKAYDVLYGIVGVHTQYIIVVYNFPMGHKDAAGNTSNCTLWYGDDNLDLAQHEEWSRHTIPHVCGYIEEMAHNFVAATRAQFGWEMTGWSIGVIASQAVAGNPVFAAGLQSTRQRQTDTFRRYQESGFVFPADIEANQVDRIHAYILWQCEQQYGAGFWKDCFAEIRKERQALSDARDDRDRRYQITVDCFDRLKGLNFKQRLTDSHISLVRDVKSLKPTEPGWNRRLE